MITLINDIKYAFRRLLDNPGFTIVAVLSLALGIGANAAIFGLLNSVMFRPLPVRNPHELRGINWSGNFNPPSTWGRSKRLPNGGKTSNCFSYQVYRELRDRGVGVTDVFGFFEFNPIAPPTAIIRGQASRLDGMMVSGNFFRGLGLQPMLGRTIMTEHDRPDVPPVAVISYHAWKAVFGGDPNVVGQGIVLDQLSATVIGVLPKDFLGIIKGRRPDVYIPLSLQPRMQGICELESPDHWWVQVMVRLEPSVDESQVIHSLSTILAEAPGVLQKDIRVVLTDGSSGLSGILAVHRRLMAKPLYLLFGLVGIVLLVTCVNLAGLLLARGAMRHHEFAVRLALGAGHGRMVRQLLTESAVLAVIGAGSGLFLAAWMKPVLSRLLWSSNTALNVQSDILVYGFIIGTCVITVVLFGLLPALRVTWTVPMARLRYRTMLGAPSLRLGKMLISTQVGLSLLLLVGAGLFTRTLINVQRVETGFNTENLLFFHADTGEYQADFCSAIGALPGVQAVTHSKNPLLTGHRSSFSISLPGKDSEILNILRLDVSETFLQTLAIPLLAGRDFRTLDTEESQRVIIVNRTLAQSAFPDQNPIGQILMVGREHYTIVGVCGDTQYYDLKTATKPIAFFPSRDGACYAVRTAVSPQNLISTVRQTLASINPGIPISDVKTLKARISDNTKQERAFSWLASSLAFLAVLQSCIGLYGLMANDVTRRTSEIGIRMALGATPQAVAWPILRGAMLMAIAGVMVGVPVVLATVRIVRSYLFGIEPYDPVTLIGAIILLLAVAVLAAWIPARRAARVNPMMALRYE
jgi:predicted permease